VAIDKAEFFSTLFDIDGIGIAITECNTIFLSDGFLEVNDRLSLSNFNFKDAIRIIAVHIKEESLVFSCGSQQ